MFLFLQIISSFVPVTNSWSYYFTWKLNKYSYKYRSRTHCAAFVVFLFCVMLLKIHFCYEFAIMGIFCLNKKTIFLVLFTKETEGTSLTWMFLTDSFQPFSVTALKEWLCAHNWSETLIGIKFGALVNFFNFFIWTIYFSRKWKTLKV